MFPDKDVATAIAGIGGTAHAIFRRVEGTSELGQVHRRQDRKEPNNADTSTAFNTSAASLTLNTRLCEAAGHSLLQVAGDGTSVRFPRCNGCCRSARAPKQAPRVCETSSHSKAAREAITQAHTETGANSGTILCPQCGGKLQWSRASSNGHVHARCMTTRECLAWME